MVTRINFISKNELLTHSCSRPDRLNRVYRPKRPQKSSSIALLVEIMIENIDYLDFSIIKNHPLGIYKL